jgi:phosphotriesterase-related protein
MPAVETVSGPVDVEELGLTLVHEHFRAIDEGTREQWPHAYDEQAELDAALACANDVKSHGVKTVVDPAALYLGRNARFAKRVAEATGLQIVLATGIYTYDALPHYFENRDADMIAAMFVHDIEQGVQGTEAKAAFLKTAADAPGITPNVEKLHRAVARASVQTGAPIMAHSHPASETGLRQVEILTAEGVDPSKIQIAHTGDTDDLDYIERLLATGVFIGMDRYGLDLYLPTEKRNATVLALLERGHAGRMFLSQDYCATIDWFPEEAAAQLEPLVKDWSMTFLFESVIPTLKERGMTDEQLDQMMVENVKAWLGS